MTELPLRCTCGRVRGAVRDVSPKTVNRVICYCADCQAFARFLGREEILDAGGGSDILQLASPRVSILEGGGELQCMRLSQKGLFRWYTGCCRTPIGNTISGRVPFIGMLADFVDGGPKDDVVGPPIARIHGRRAVGTPPLPVHDTVPIGALLTMITSLIGWKLTVRGEDPFFDPVTKQPRVAPHILAGAAIAS